MVNPIVCGPGSEENLCKLVDIAIKEEQEGQQGYEELKRGLDARKRDTFMSNYPKNREFSRIFSQVEKIRKQEGKNIDKLNNIKLKIGCR